MGDREREDCTEGFSNAFSTCLQKIQAERREEKKIQFFL